MKPFKFLKRYYTFYTNIRFKFPHNSFSQWVCTIICFLQYTSLTFYISDPLSCLQTSIGADAFSHLQCFFALIPWIFATSTYIHDSMFFFVINIVSLIILEIGVRYNNKYKRCPLFYLKFVKYFQSFYCPIIEFPLFYRTLITIDLISTRNGKTNTMQLLSLLSFIISFLNVFIIFFHSYLHSIFLAPIDFIPTSLLDIYDGKTNTVLFIFRYTVNLCSYFIYIATDIMYVILIAILIFIFFLIMYYLRVMTVLHVSSVGSYFELSPFFCFPFEIALQFGYSNDWHLVIFLLFVLHVVFICALKTVNFFIKKEALKIFSVLIRRNEEEEEEENELTSNRSNETEIPSFASGNVVSGLRIMFLYHSDPHFFTRFAYIQHRSGVRASPMIEIIRFLGIFPSKRIEMLKELKALKSNSNYNRFLIFFYSKVLRSLTNKCKDKNLLVLNYYQRSFIVHNHLFWLARTQKKFLSSIIEACSVSYFYYEYKLEIKNLISRFYFDPYLYRRFGDFLLMAAGDYENSVFYQKFADSIENSEVKLTDTLVHKYIKFNPRILRFLNEDEYKASSVNDRTLIQKKILHSKNDTFFNSSKFSTNNTAIKKHRRKQTLNSTNSNSGFNSNSLKNTNESFRSDYSFNSEVNNNYSSENSTATPSPMVTASESPLVTTNNNSGGSELNQLNESDFADGIEYIEKPSASYLQTSKRWIPFFPLIGNIISCVLILSFLFQIIPIENKTVNSFAAIEREKPEMIHLFIDTGNAVFLPFSLTYQQPAQIGIHGTNENKEITQMRIKNIENLFNSNFYSNYSIPTQFISDATTEIYHFLNTEIERKFLNEINNTNSSIECRNEFYMSLNNVIIFFIDISQIRNLTGLMVSHLSKSIRLISDAKYSMCDVLQFFYHNVRVYPFEMMEKLENKLINIINEFEILNNHIELNDFLSKSLLIYSLISLFFIIVYSLAMTLQVNLTMKDQKAAVSFFASKERLKCLLFQKVDESWDVLTLFLQPEIVHFLQLRGYYDVVDEISQSGNSKKSLALLLFEREEESFSNHSKSEEITHEEFEENYEDTNNNKIQEANPFYTITSPLLPITIIDENQNENERENISLSTSSNDHNQTQKVERNEVRQTFYDRFQLEEMIEHAFNTTKETTKFSWIYTFNFLIFPWLLVITSILLLYYPIHYHSSIETDLAKSALHEGHQLFACYELIKVTADYLYTKEKNVTKFIQIHEMLDTTKIVSSFKASYSSQITEYYRREQCMQLLGITCTSISELVQEVINNNIDTERLTMLILPAFVQFGRNVLGEFFYQESEYLPKILSLSQQAFYTIICLMAVSYLARIFWENSAGLIEGFNSLFHFPELLIQNNEKIVESEMNDRIQDDITSHSLNESDSALNSLMWQIYRDKNGEKLPSTVIYISSLRKNGEIYSISENVEQILNRSSTSFIGQYLNENFPIVPSENDQENTEELRQFFMPDLTKKVFLSKTVSKSGFLNLTLMIEDFHSQSNKSYKEDTISEKLMNFMPTYFAKSIGVNGLQSFEFKDPIVVYMRFDSNLPQMVLEQYFTVINNAIMNFSSIKAILADGGFFVFTTIKAVNPIIPFLFARDMINDSKFPKRGRPTNGTWSILIVKIDLIMASVCYDDVCEPFLQTNLDNFDSKAKEKILFHLKKEQICFESRFEGVLKGITEKGEKVKKSINGIDYDLVSFSFSQYLSNLKNLI